MCDDFFFFFLDRTLYGVTLHFFFFFLEGDVANFVRIAVNVRVELQ